MWQVVSQSSSITRKAREQQRTDTDRWRSRFSDWKLASINITQIVCTDAFLGFSSSNKCSWGEQRSWWRNWSKWKQQQISRHLSALVNNLGLKKEKKRKVKSECSSCTVFLAHVVSSFIQSCFTKRCASPPVVFHTVTQRSFKLGFKSWSKAVKHPTMRLNSIFS